MNNEKLNIHIHEDRQALGQHAADQIIADLNQILEKQEIARVVFAAAPSQNETLRSLVERKDEVDWNRVIAFHMDEYIGLDSNDTRGFFNFLDASLFSKCPFMQLHRIDSQNLEHFIEEFSKEQIDLVCLGIGENGHLAFNDPPVADFNDSEIIKKVELDITCRQQQVNDGMFASLDEVPKYAMTLTIPSLFNAKILHCMVPGKTKAKAVFSTLHDEISTKCPSTLLRKHLQCSLYVDRDSMSLSA